MYTTSWYQNGNISYQKKTTLRVSLPDGKFIAMEFQGEKTIAQLLCQDADQIFFPNIHVWKLLCNFQLAVQKLRGHFPVRDRDR